MCNRSKHGRLVLAIIVILHLCLLRISFRHKCVVQTSSLSFSFFVALLLVFLYPILSVFFFFVLYFPSVFSFSSVFRCISSVFFLCLSSATFLLLYYLSLRLFMYFIIIIIVIIIIVTMIITTFIIIIVIIISIIIIIIIILLFFFSSFLYFLSFNFSSPFSAYFSILSFSFGFLTLFLLCPNPEL